MRLIERMNCVQALKGMNVNMVQHLEIEFRQNMKICVQNVVFRFEFANISFKYNGRRPIDRYSHIHWHSIFYVFIQYKPHKHRNTHIQTKRLICRFFHCVMLELPTNTINHDKSAIFCFSFSPHF